MTAESQNTGESWARLHVISKCREVKAHREKICGRVRDYFEQHFQIAAQPRVVCIFDGQDHERLKQELGGEANRGVCVPTKMCGLLLWPDYTRSLIAPFDPRVGENVCPTA